MINTNLHLLRHLVHPFRGTPKPERVGVGDLVTSIDPPFHARTTTAMGSAASVPLLGCARCASGADQDGRCAAAAAAATHKDDDDEDEHNDNDNDNDDEVDDVELEIAGLLEGNDALPASAYEALRSRLSRDDSSRESFLRLMGIYGACAAAESGNISLLKLAVDSFGFRPDASPSSAPPSTEKRFVSFGAHVFAGVRSDPAGDTPLLCAARRGHDDVLELLLARGALVHRRGPGKIFTRDSSRAGVDDLTTMTYAMTALHVAVDGNHHRCVSILLDYGARVDARFRSGWDHAGYRALDLAVMRGHIACIRLLLDRGASLASFGGSFRRTALHYAVLEEHCGCMRLLLDRGANREARDLNGWTPMGLAAFYGRVKALRLLIDLGAKIDGKPSVNPSISKFQAPLYAATIIGGGEQIECMRLLLDRGAKINALTAEMVGGLPSERRTAIHSAMARGKIRCVMVLVERGATIGGELSPFVVRSPPIRILIKPRVAAALRTCASQRLRALEAMDDDSKPKIEAASGECIVSLRRALRPGEFPEAAIEAVVAAVRAEQGAARTRVLETIASRRPPAPAPPDSFVCPISRDVMRDPVQASDGYTYERDAIEAWFALHDTSPMTRATIDRRLVPDRKRAEEIRGGGNVWAAASP